jgi:endo-1,4-beta-xylanase
MRLSTYLILVLSSLRCVAAEPLPTGGVDLVTTQSQLSGFGGQGGSFAKVPVTGQNFSEAIRITVATAEPDKPWNAQLTTPFTAGSVKSGDKLLIVYMARCVGGGGRAVAKLQLAEPSSPMVGMTGTAKLGAEWSQVSQALVAKAAAPEGKGELVIFLGEQMQTVEISSVRVLNYGPEMDLAKLPQPRETYAGRELAAPWRQAALGRIEKLRKADLAFQLTDAAGKSRPHATVVVELERHEFGFGSCVTRQLLTQPGSDGERYRDIAQRTFSRVVFENDLKPDSFPHDEAGRAELEKSLGWLKSHGISIRGHYLMQEAVDGWSRDRLGDPAKLKAELLASVQERIATLGDRVVEWDVINHPIAWQNAEVFAQKAPPLDTLAMDVFLEARRLTPLPLCINEDQLFRPGAQQDKTYALLEKLKREGVRVDGLGNQAHFHCSFLPSPEDQLRITDRFAAVVPRQLITEFDIVANGDDTLAADYLRDSLIACFSHPAYDGFMLWGFWEGSHWIPEAALWRKDWSPKPAALVWEDWVGKRWHTRQTLTSDAAGLVKWRGFKGSYRLSLGTAKSDALLPGTATAPVVAKVP